MKKALLYFYHLYTEAMIYKMLIKENFVVILVNSAVEDGFYVKKRLADLWPEAHGRVIIFFIQFENATKEIQTVASNLIERDEYMVLASAKRKDVGFDLNPIPSYVKARFIVTTDKNIILKFFNHFKVSSKK